MQETTNFRIMLINDFCDNYMEKIFYFCLKKTSSNVEAQDLTQDIALVIITALNKGTIPVRFSAWVWQIARNRYCLWAKEKHKRNNSVSDCDMSDLDIVDESNNILEILIKDEEMALLSRELAFIKSEYRHIVLAYYIEHKSVREIALSLNLSVNTVKSRLYRAREILKEGMDMAREFGKLSYNPQNIGFICNGLFSADNEPDIYISRLLCKNIMLAAYRNPSTAEELAIEVGVALPYIEEELKNLTSATLMKKNANKYETNFLIVSATAQEKIYAHLRGITPELTKAIIDAMEYEVKWKNENNPKGHENYQDFEDMKWTLLMYQTDVINFDTLHAYNSTTNKLLTKNLGKWGHTIRPNEGEWDVLGLESYLGERPCFVGLHGCVNSPAERNFEDICFQQFKFKYKKIADKTPECMPYAYAKALVCIARGESEKLENSAISYLLQNGYIKKEGDLYKPTFLVMFKSDKNKMPALAKGELENLRQKATNIAMRHYLFCRDEIKKEVPEFLKDDEYQIDHACENIFSMRGAVLEEALKIGYISYAENDDRKMLGTFLRI